MVNWQNMLTPRVFYEYSVNRPIYAEKKYVDSLLRAKGNKAHHAFLTVAIKKIHITTDTNSKKYSWESSDKSQRRFFTLLKNW